ncbi:hypothetical protein BXU09_18370 [Deinococcus sp. LM3]|nr:hypothetical protein BXU09_18370 [Deinococcus sp. LM3]
MVEAVAKSRWRGTVVEAPVVNTAVSVELVPVVKPAKPPSLNCSTRIWVTALTRVVARTVWACSAEVLVARGMMATTKPTTRTAIVTATRTSMRVKPRMGGGVDLIMMTPQVV